LEGLQAAGNNLLKILQVIQNEALSRKFTYDVGNIKKVTWAKHAGTMDVSALLCGL
jgi:hypothetical protein